MSRMSELHLTVHEAVTKGLSFGDIVTLVRNEHGLTDINFVRTMIDVITERLNYADEDDDAVL